MTEKATEKHLSREILGLLALSVLFAAVLFQFLRMTATGIIDNILFLQDVVLTEALYAQIDDWVFHLSFLVSVGFFVVLFLFLLGERLSYIHDILKGIAALQEGEEGYVVPVEGGNELTRLAIAVNYLSRSQKEVKEKERILQEDKDQFIRALCHDIRTPLTSILGYSELLTGEQTISSEEQSRCLTLIGSKARQIKEMTDVLLDGTKRNPERFEDICLLMAQLVGGFEEMLEEHFQIETTLNCPTVPGVFDVQEMCRIFDNITSNVEKYADPKSPVKLAVVLEQEQLVIRQENGIRPLQEPAPGYRLGIRSIQRIVQNYDGTVDIRKNDTNYCITVTLSRF